MKKEIGRVGPMFPIIPMQELNGKKVGTNPDWQHGVKVEVGPLLKTGGNDLLVDARNEDGVAAFVAWISIELADGIASQA